MKKKRFKNTYEYEEWVYAKTTETSSISIEYFSGDDSIKIMEAIPESLKIQTSYKRGSGKEKIVNVSPSNKLSMQSTPDRQLLSNFSYIFAIDTNTNIIDEDKISVSVIYVSIPKRDNRKEGIYFFPEVSFLFTNIKPEINPETIGWHIFISKCLKLDKLSPTDKIALIVDSELDKHEKYNSRALPYYKGYYLPKQIKFIYASSDVGKSKYLANQMISYCDTMSKKVLDEIKEEKIKIPLLNNGDENYDGYYPVISKRKINES